MLSGDTMKILIVSEIVAGRGHQKAAESIAKAINRIKPISDVKIVNLIGKMSKRLEYIVEVIYMKMITKTPKVWGWIHQRDSFFSLIFKKIISLVMVENLKKILETEKPNYVIATHASGLGALSKLREKYNYKIAAVFTDYQINQFWIHPKIDLYFVGHEDFKNRLINEFNISEKKIHVSGIPIDPQFSIENKKETLQSNPTDLSAKFNVLVMGGGLGLGGIKEVIFSLNLLVDIPINIIVVTGSNQKLFNDLNRIVSQLNISVQLLGYIEDMSKLMKHSNVLITKPGGLTISEALVIPVPMILFNPIPGQEEENSRFLIKHKAAIRADKIEEINDMISDLYRNKVLYESLKQNQLKIAKPNASLLIAQTICNEKNFLPH